MVSIELDKEQADRLYRLIAWSMVACSMGPEEEARLEEILEMLRPTQPIGPGDVIDAN